MAQEATITIGGCDLDCTFTVSGGKFKGDHMTPPDPIEVEVESVWYGPPSEDEGGITVNVTDLIEAFGGMGRVETAIRETL